MTMRLNRLDLNLLVALNALLAERSITRAAERIFLSQSATSGTLARLREFFGDELLVRVGPKMKLTPLAESLEAPVHNILMQIQATVERGVEFDAASSERKFRVLCTDYSSTVILKRVIRDMAKAAPNVRLEVIMAADNPAGELELGNVDFLLMPRYVMSDENPKLSLYDESFVCLVCKDHPKIESKLSLKQFTEYGHVGVRFGSNRTSSQDIDLLHDIHGLEPKIEIIASTFNAIPEYLPGTNRIATVYKKLAEQWCEYLPLKMVPLPIDMPVIPWELQWHQYRNLDPGIQWMAQFIKSTTVGAESAS